MAIVTVLCDKCFYYFQFLLYMLIAFLFVFKSVFVLLTLSIALYVYYQVSFGFFCFFSFQEMMRFLLQRHRLISFLLYTIGKKRKHFGKFLYHLNECLGFYLSVFEGTSPSTPEKLVSSHNLVTPSNLMPPLPPPLSKRRFLVS